MLYVYQVNVHRFANASSHMIISEECIPALQIHTRSATTLAIVKGGSEIIVDLCSKCLYRSRIVPFTDSLKQTVLEAMQSGGDR